MKKLSGIFLAVLTFFSSTLNVFADTIEVFEEKTQTINKEDYESLKEEVEKKVFELNESDDDYVYDYEISIDEEKDEVVVTETQTISSSQKFTSEEEAKKFYDEYELEDSWKKGELSISSDTENVKVNGDEITITCKEATCTEEIKALESALNEYQELEVVSKNTTSKDDTKTIVYAIDGKEQEVHFEDAIKLVATLNPELEGYTLVKNEYILVKKGSVDSKTFKDIVGTDKFETYEEAKEAADKFLSNDEYEDKVAILVKVLDKTEKVTNKTTLPGQLTEELAYAIALEDAKKELENAIETGKITIEGTIEEAKKALEKAYETGDIQLSSIDYDGRIVYYSLPEQRTVESSEELTQTFYTKTGAELAKAALEATAKELEGTDISIEDINLIETNEEATNVSEAVSVPGRNGNYPLIPSSNTYYSLRNGNKIVIWTVDTLTSDKKDEITKSLKENDNTISTVEFVTGYNQETTIDGIGTFKFKKTEKNFFGHITYTYSIVVSSDTSNLSLETGIITTGKVYKLSYKTVTKTTLWYVDKNEIKYGFDWTVQGGGATVTRDLFKVQSILSGKIYDYTMAYRVNTTEAYTSYIPSFDIYKEAIKTNATATYKITREKAATGTVNPGTGEEGQITPPNTGVEVNFFLQGALLISILVAIASLKRLCK